MDRQDLDRILKDTPKVEPRPDFAASVMADVHREAEAPAIAFPWHLAGVAVGIDTEVTEMTTLAAERNVQVQAKRHTGRRRGERRPGLAVHGFGGPDRERRVIRDEIAADLGLLDLGGRMGHPPTILTGPSHRLPAGTR